MQPPAEPNLDDLRERVARSLSEIHDLYEDAVSVACIAWYEAKATFRPSLDWEGHLQSQIEIAVADFLATERQHTRDAVRLSDSLPTDAWDEVDPPHPDLPALTEDLLATLSARLSPQEYEIITLHHGFQNGPPLSLREIGRILDVPLTTVRRRYHRAKATLKHSLTQ